MTYVFRVPELIPYLMPRHNCLFVYYRASNFFKLAINYNLYVIWSHPNLTSFFLFVPVGVSWKEDILATIFFLQILLSGSGQGTIFLQHMAYVFVEFLSEHHALEDTVWIEYR